MLFDEKKFEFDMNGKKCFFATGKIARKAHSAVLAGMGDTVILATVSIGDPLPDADYFPMSIEYIEKMAAAGVISSSRFVKRERFPSDDAILKARIIDRSIRPMFPSDYRNEVLIIVEILSFDPDNDPSILAINAVSAALMLSKVPFDGPISGVRVGKPDGEFIQMMDHIERGGTALNLPINLVLAGNETKITNIDASAFEKSEDELLNAIKFGQLELSKWQKAQEDFISQFKIEKSEYVSYATPTDLIDKVRANYINDIKEVMDISAYDNVDPAKVRLDAKAKTKELLDKISADMAGAYSKLQIRECYEILAKEQMRKVITEEQRRLDGRKFDEIREIAVEVGILPRAHGTGLFTRGMTQILTIATLGSIRRQQTIEDMTGEDSRTFMHFYSQYPFTMGEAGRYKYMPGRREIGHGALAEKGLAPVIPTTEEFPYTIICNSEIMSENGSSSMGSACASSLALMDAGVPIKKHVAGVALGLLFDEEKPEDSVIMTDMRDVEDFWGYMDFKVLGTKDGITAVQMDTKAKGLPIVIFEKAFEQAKLARMKILAEMEKIIDKPRASISQYAPKVEVVKIPISKIGDLIGPGGKNIKAINEETATEIEIEEDGTVYIFGDSAESITEAVRRVKLVAFEPEVGQIYDGVVASVMDYGVFVDIAPKVSGLVHVSEISDEFVKDINSVVKVGDKFKVKLIAIDDQGRLKLSRKGIKE